MLSTRAIGLGVIVISAVATWLCLDRDEVGVSVSREQASRVFGGQTTTHYYKLNGGQNFCSGSEYGRCTGQNGCAPSTTAIELAGPGTKDFVPKQPCSKKICEGVVVNCGEMNITGCT